MRSCLGLALVVAALGSACSKKRSAPPITVAGSVVIRTSPANGASAVEPDAAVTVEFDKPTAQIPDGELFVDDRSNRLAGTWSPVGDGKTWRWQPDVQLPRGNTVRLVAAGTLGSQTLASFTVREVRDVATHERLAQRATGALTWPNGRRVVIFENEDVFEVDQNGLTQRFVTCPPNASTYGDGDYVYAGYDALLDRAIVVRANLDGTSMTYPLPKGGLFFGMNGNGDVVGFVDSVNGIASEWGPWVLRADGVQFEWMGSLELPFYEVRSVDIDGEGSVVVAYPDADNARLARFVADDLVPRVYDLPAAANGLSFALHADGRGLLSWVTPEGIAVARFDPTLGLRALPQVLPPLLDAPPPPNPGLLPPVSTPGVTGLHVSCAEGGDAIVRWAWTSHTIFTSSTYFVARVSSTDVVLGPEEIGTGNPGFVPWWSSVASRQRRELWLVSAVGNNVSLRRGLPTQGLDDADVIYSQTQPGLAFHRPLVAHDDSGRGVIVVNELDAGTLTPASCRIVVRD